LFAPDIAAPKSANLGKLKSPICCRFQEKWEKLTPPNYKSIEIGLNTISEDICIKQFLPTLVIVAKQFNSFFTKTKENRGGGGNLSPSYKY
jgi:hypothetical protein